MYYATIYDFKLFYWQMAFVIHEFANGTMQVLHVCVLEINNNNNKISGRNVF